MEIDVKQCINEIIRQLRTMESLMASHQKAAETNSKMGWVFDSGLVPNPPVNHSYNSPTGILVICFRHQDRRFHKKHEVTIESHFCFLHPGIIKSRCSELITNHEYLGICDQLDEDYRTGWEWVELDIFANNGQAPSEIWKKPKNGNSYAAYCEVLSAFMFIPELVEIIKISGISLCLAGYIVLKPSPDLTKEVKEACTLRLAYKKDCGIHLGLISGSEKIEGNCCPQVRKLAFN